MTASPSPVPPESGPSPRRYLALWLPFLPTDRLRRGGFGAPDEPLVLCEPVKGALRIAAADREALRLGLRPGLGLADARARIPDLRAADHDPAADSTLLLRLAEACERWTPLVALDPPDGLILDVTGCAHLRGGEEALRGDVIAHLAAWGFARRAALAGTPDAARALARFGRAQVVPPGGEGRAVRSLPVAALGVPEETRADLALAGLRRIADLTDLPGAPLAARFGADLPRRLARVLGLEDRRITPLRARPAVHVARAFAEPVAHAAAIEGALADLVGQAARRLESAGEGGRTFAASFHRSDGAVRRITVGTLRPSRDPRTILGLLRERLDALADPLDPGYGFDLVRLAVPVCEPLAAVQADLGGGADEDGAVCDLVDRLVARFGPARVLRFAAADTHDPVRAARLVPHARPRAASWPEQEPGEPPGRPLQLLAPPEPIEALAEIPDGPPIRFRWRGAVHDVARAEGPERIAPEWWRRGAPTPDEEGAPAGENVAPLPPTRDYYRVEDAQGRRFWVFRAGLYGRETERPRWYLHGLFA